MAKGKRFGPTRATVALTQAATDFEVMTYDHDPRAQAYGLEASDALGLDPAEVFKTLVAKVDDELVVALVAVPRRLDLKALAKAAGGRKAALADVATAERKTGYVAGGISPLGQRSQLRTFLDVDALELAAVYISAGRRGTEIKLRPHDLIAAVDAAVAPLAVR